MILRSIFSVSCALLFVSNALGATFPKGFKWCVATAAHQVEGNNSNSDWWAWEQIPGKIHQGEKSGAACDHWNRLKQDAQLLKDLNITEYRFSVEWAKIEPEEGRWNWDAVKHYRKELALLRAQGIQPMITLQHFTFPIWISKKGGWKWGGIAPSFAKYASFVMAEIAPDAHDWITINEPMVQLVYGYVKGTFPPGITGEFGNVVEPMIGMLKAHAAAYHALKGRKTDVRIGVAHHLRVFTPNWWINPLEQLAAKSFSEVFNWSFLMALETGKLSANIPFALKVDQKISGLQGTQDFLGVNYYSRDMVEIPFPFQISQQRTFVKPGVPTTDMGWEIYPEGFYDLLKEVARRVPGKAIFITENGIADRDDSKRIEFIKAHLTALKKAMDEGVPVEGYCYWSFMDNFEWADGFEPRFGLYAVDYKTQARTPRPSAGFFSKLAKENRF